MLEIGGQAGDFAVDDGIRRQQWSGVTVGGDVVCEGWDGILIARVPVGQLGERLKRAGGYLRNDTAREAGVLVEAGDDIAAVGFITRIWKQAVKWGQALETIVKGGVHRMIRPQIVGHIRRSIISLPHRGEGREWAGLHESFRRNLGLAGHPSAEKIKHEWRRIGHQAGQAIRFREIVVVERLPNILGRLFPIHHAVGQPRPPRDIDVQIDADALVAGVTPFKELRIEAGNGLDLGSWRNRHGFSVIAGDWDIMAAGQMKSRLQSERKIRGYGHGSLGRTENTALAGLQSDWSLDVIHEGGNCRHWRVPSRYQPPRCGTEERTRLEVLACSIGPHRVTQIGGN